MTHKSPRPDVVSVTSHPERDRVIVTLEYGTVDWMEILDRYSRVVVTRVVDQVVSDLVTSAAIQARVATIRAELPVRIEEAVAKAIAAEVLS